MFTSTMKFLMLTATIAVIVTVTVDASNHKHQPPTAIVDKLQSLIKSRYNQEQDHVEEYLRIPEIDRYEYDSSSSSSSEDQDKISNEHYYSQYKPEYKSHTQSYKATSQKSVRPYPQPMYPDSSNKSPYSSYQPAPQRYTTQRPASYKPSHHETIYKPPQQKEYKPQPLRRPTYEPSNLKSQYPESPRGPPRPELAYPIQKPPSYRQNLEQMYKRPSEAQPSRQRTYFDSPYSRQPHDQGYTKQPLQSSHSSYYKQPSDRLPYRPMPSTPGYTQQTCTQHSHKASQKSHKLAQKASQATQYSQQDYKPSPVVTGYNNQKAYSPHDSPDRSYSRYPYDDPRSFTYSQYSMRQDFPKTSSQQSISPSYNRYNHNYRSSDQSRTVY